LPFELGDVARIFNSLPYAILMERKGGMYVAIHREHSRSHQSYPSTKLKRETCNTPIATLCDKASPASLFSAMLLSRPIANHAYAYPQDK
jgi:hypothetical protein